MIWLLLVACSFATGAAAPPRWTVVVWPAVSLALGIYEVETEGPNYDMPGFGYYVGGVAAALCVIGWLGGRLIRRWSATRQ